jgi:ribosomal protein S18 acetylase RimI-like enzyme
MSELNFLPLTRDRPAGDVIAMMRALFDEDPPSSPVDPTRFPATIEALLAEPSRGTILLFEEADVLRGYAILIPYWSNEYGGTIVYVDELFVVPKARNRGLAHRFFDFLASSKPFDALALALEVTPANARAQRLYESIGFSKRRNSTFLLRIVR